MSAALEKDPENTHLQRQQLLIPSAQICTIDSFCTTLVREHFDDPKISVSPDFRMLEESEAKFLKQAAVTATVEECYETEKEEFKTLVELLFSGRDDAKIEETVLKLYEYSRAYPSPKKWLEDSLASYDETIPLRKSKIFAELLCSLSSAVSYAYALAEQSLKELLLNAETAVSKAAAILTQEKALLEQLQQCLEASDLDGVRERVQNYQPETWSSGGKAIKDLDAIKKAKASR
ncbi:MAG TPA: UvrD-helicase domain-containing protein, partial [Clostridiales bacterium]|nr:UvrD-helicase domain-containing protein [Clostridiales bacterium]